MLRNKAANTPSNNPKNKPMAWFYGDHLVLFNAVIYDFLPIYPWNIACDLYFNRCV
jgi:hypothetical protein